MYFTYIFPNNWPNSELSCQIFIFEQKAAVNFLFDILNLFYPRSCLLCTNALLDKENHICIACNHELPVTGFSKISENALEKTFYGRVPLQGATALLYFTKQGKTQQLIHLLKYKGKQQIGFWAGNYLGHLMSESKRFQLIDAIVPVPLHPKKLKKRGYNQVIRFGRQLAAVLQLPFHEELLQRVGHADTQSKRTRVDRWENVRDQFILNPNIKLISSNLLLIDDVVTTGATVESCYHALKGIPELKLSLACIAFTK